MNDDFDDLDRALFALPLEVPPPTMRAAILRQTVGAHAVARARVTTHGSPFSTWEILALGTGFAVTVWLVLLIVWNHAAAAAVSADAIAVGRAFADPALLFWLTAGAAVAAWVSLVHAAPLVRSRS